jgi:hypothetical protein
MSGEKLEHTLLCKLVGLTKKEPLLAAFLASLNSHPQTDRCEDDEFYYDSYRDLGMSFLFEGSPEFLSAIFLYADGVDGYEEYKGSLPNSLNFSDTRQDVLQRLGQPAKSGGNKYSDLMGEVIPHWGKYHIEDYHLHITFGRSEERISLVTLMPLPDSQCETA